MAIDRIEQRHRLSHVPLIMTNSGKSVSHIYEFTYDSLSGEVNLLDHSPVLSAQFMTAPTGHAREILNLAPAAPPRPEEGGIREWNW